MHGISNRSLWLRGWSWCRLRGWCHIAHHWRRLRHRCWLYRLNNSRLNHRAWSWLRGLCFGHRWQVAHKINRFRISFDRECSFTQIGKRIMTASATRGKYGIQRRKGIRLGRLRCRCWHIALTLLALLHRKTRTV